MRRNTDGKGHGLFGGTVSAVLFAAVCLGVVLLIAGLMSTVWGIGMASLTVLLVLQMLVPAAIVVGVVIALVQRWKEVRNGEEEEARKY